MPSVSAPQAKLMSALAHGWRPAGYAKSHLPSPAVAKEFHEADKKKGEFMHYKADGGKVGVLRSALDAIAHRLPTPAEKLARAGSQLSTPGFDPYNSADYLARQAAIEAEAAQHLGSAINTPAKADGGKVGSVVNFARAGTKTLLDRIEGAFHNPYTANTDQLRQDVSKYWTTKAPPAAIAAPAAPKEPSVEDLTAQLHDLASKSYADGGPVDAPKNRVRTYARAGSGASIDPLRLISHAADRVSAAVSDDPHHMLARIAGGLSSQLAGLSPSGKAEFGRVPGIVNETKALPAGMADLGKGLADAGGAVADAAGPASATNPILSSLQAARSGMDYLQDKYGDVAPAWSRKAESNADALHAAVHKQMGLSKPQGFAENAAEAAGTMLGQVPIIGQEEKGASMLGKLIKSPVEWLSPSIRPRVSNYAAGTLAGGMFGTAGDDPQPPPTQARGDGPIKERFE